jgi:hypothetical protein
MQAGADPYGPGYWQLAAVLTENGIPTAAERDAWSPAQVARVVRQIGD